MRFAFALPPHARPPYIPADWRVYCAPRPLPGDKRWQGDFLAGVFYAANPPGTDETDIHSLHGRRMFYLTDAQAKALVTDWLQRTDPEAPDAIKCCEEHGLWREQLYYASEGLQAHEVDYWITQALPPG